MSHLATIKTEIKDIEAVKRMCREKGWTFNENAKSYEGVGWRRVCAHSITFPNCPMCQLGLEQTPVGYVMGFDDMLQMNEMWKGMRSEVGKGGERILQLYGVHKATLEAERLGYSVERNEGQNGSIELIVTGMA